MKTLDSQTHLVQLYEADDKALARNVSAYLVEGLNQGSGLFVVATLRHRESFLSELTNAGIDTDSISQDGRMVVLDAGETLARLMIEGYPDAERFDAVIGAAVRDGVARSQGRELFAYGDMVGSLWETQQFPAAIRLEQLWNRLLRAVPFRLYCSYPIDIFGSQFDAAIFDTLICAHTHLVPSGTNGELESALRRAMQDALGARAAQLEEAAAKYDRSSTRVPKGESTILWLRKNMPDRVDEILSRAREYYRALT